MVQVWVPLCYSLSSRSQVCLYLLFPRDQLQRLFSSFINLIRRQTTPSALVGQQFSFYSSCFPWKGVLTRIHPVPSPFSTKGVPHPPMPFEDMIFIGFVPQENRYLLLVSFYSIFLPTSMSHLCPCVKGLVSSVSQLMPSHQRLQYSCGQHTQHICPPLPYSCSPDFMPTLEITRDPRTWDNLCALGSFSNHSRLLTQSHQTSVQWPQALLLPPISTSIFSCFLSSLGVCFLPLST